MYLDHRYSLAAKTQKQAITETVSVKRAMTIQANMWYVP